MDGEQLIETYSARVECPYEGCYFIFGFENVENEEEGRQILLQVVRLHGRQRHGSTTAFDPKVFTISAGMTRAAERPKLAN